MTAYEQQVHNTSNYYDREIQKLEQDDIEILHSVVPGSRPKQIINNEIDEGIDES